MRTVFIITDGSGHRKIRQGWQGGSIAVYGENSLYRVEAVTASSLLKRTNEDGRQNSRSNDRENSGEKKSKGFAELLTDAAGKANESRNVRVRTTGYTRSGVPSEFYIKMRDYTYQK